MTMDRISHTCVRIQQDCKKKIYLELVLQSMSETRIDDYNRFVPASYLRTRYNDPEEERSQFYLHSFHKFYQQYHTQWDHTTARLLEFGGGPVIVPLISAAPLVSEIVFSDYAESNRNEVQQWKDNDPNAHDWMPYIRHVVHKLDGNALSEAAVTRERILRNRLQYVVSCDINADQENLLGCEAVRKPFDIISVNACVEAAVDSYGQYLTCLAKLKTLLKAGGLMIGMHTLGTSWWKVQDEKYKCIPLTEGTVVASLQQTGFSVLEKKTASMTYKHSVVGTVFGSTKTRVFFTVAKAN